MIKMLFYILVLLASIYNIFWGFFAEFKIIPMLFFALMIIISLLEIDSYITNKKKNNK